MCVGCAGAGRSSGETGSGGPGPPLFAAEPTIRVGIARADEGVAVGSWGRWWIREASSSRPIAVVEGEAPWRVVRLPFESALRVVRPDGHLSPPHAGPLVVAPLGPSPLFVDGEEYPGSIDVLLGPDGTVTAVNVVPLETYLPGVVAREMGRPGREAYQALRAQAIAARTYALKRLGSRAALGFDVFAGDADQAYSGVVPAADSLAARAVAETRGRALLYNGYLIDAYFHSTCGGHTARVEDVFDHPPAPFLTSVADVRPDDGYWCQDSRYFRWTATFDREGLAERLAENLPGLVPVPPEGPGEPLDMELLETTPEGRALVLGIETSTGRFAVVGDRIRTVFTDAGERLRSTLFLFRPRREGGRLVELTLVGGGWGHGVGMCQVGAMGRARAGHDDRRILAAYYPGTTIATVYP